MRDRESVLDGVMSSHMQQKQTEHQTEALLRNMFSPNSVVTFTQQGNVTTYADTYLDVRFDSSSPTNAPDVQSCRDNAILLSFRERMELISDEKLYHSLHKNIKLHHFQNV